MPNHKISKKSYKNPFDGSVDLEVAKKNVSVLAVTSFFTYGY
jgi:hypothetical protein